MSVRLLHGQLNDLDIRLLRIFRAIVECGGMAAAELELNISPSAISRHLKDLEIRLGGLNLCRRGRAGFAVTAEGQKIYDATLRLQAAMDSFRSEVNDLHQRITGNLTVAMGDKTMTNPKARIAQAMRSFASRAPEVTLEMHVHPLNLIEPRVIDGTFQIGIVPSHHRSSRSLDYFPLFTENMNLYCAPSHPLHDTDHANLDWNDIRKHDYAGLGYDSPNMELSQKINLKRKATAYDQEAILTLISSGCYVGFLPSHYAESFVKSGRIRRIDNDLFGYGVQYNGIIRRAPETSRSVRTMMDCLVKVHGLEISERRRPPLPCAAVAH